MLRGYKFGEYLGKDMSSIWKPKSGSTRRSNGRPPCFSASAASMEVNSPVPTKANIYPNAGAGIQYVIKEKEGMVLNLEYAKGKGDNQGVYLKFGYGF